MKITYIEKLQLRPKNKEQLETINKIIGEYSSQGYRLTLRQLYYQLVSRGIIPNKQKEYCKLSTLLTKGRMAGIVDWEIIEDRLRIPERPSVWENPKEIIETCAKQYRRDRMEGQNVYIEVWVEKDALSGVLKRATNPFGCYLMINRGYSSTSAMHDAYLRFTEAWDNNKRVVILYLGDHDPSGLDMVRDIQKRIETFGIFGDFEIIRIALTEKQIDRYNPPPNPAKFSDPRAEWYISEYGKVSWEVDALPPDILNHLVQEKIKELIDQSTYDASLLKESEERKRLEKVATSF